MSTTTRIGSSGLGISFFDIVNDGRRPSYTPSSQSYQVASQSFQTSSWPRSSNQSTEGAVAERRFATDHRTNIYTPSLPPRKVDVDPETNCSELLEEILNSALRDQAETFVRKASTPRVGFGSPPIFSPPSISNRRAFGTASVPPQDDDDQQLQNSNESFESRHHCSHTVSSPLNSGIAPSNSGPEIRGASESHYRTLSTGLSPKPNSSHSFSNLNNRIVKRLPRFPNISKRIRVPSQVFPFFTREQEVGIEEKVYSKIHGCERHTNCTDCTNIEFAYWENLTMSTSIPADERQKIIANNKSLRNIKNELENLLENGMISDDTYDTMINALPAETSLNSAGRRNVIPSSPTPTPDTNPLNAAISNMRINNPSSNEPPSYSSSTTAPPALPGRAPSQPPERPEIGRATSLYPYEGAPEDCSFAVGETLIIYEYMNNEWCYGKNLSTGKQGLFPTNYVQIKPQAPTPNPSAYGAYNEKQNGYGAGYSGQYHQQGPPPPGPSNPYNSAVPPMAVAEQPSENKPGKGSEMGKKFGKKLGNAAIFGAGVTIGGNIVNSIF